MVTRSLGVALRPLSPAYRAKARALYRERAKRPRFDRALLEACLFDIQNDLEHRSPTHPQVALLNEVRNLLLDDLGVNEGEAMNRLRASHGEPPFRWPHAERVAAIMAEKRRPAPRCAPARAA